jgi:hypothetical protein
MQHRVLVASKNPVQEKFAELATGELEALWSCTLRSPPSVSKARKRSPGDWVFLDSRIHAPTAPAMRSGCRTSRYLSAVRERAFRWSLEVIFLEGGGFFVRGRCFPGSGGLFHHVDIFGRTRCDRVPARSPEKR